MTSIRILAAVVLAVAPAAHAGLASLESKIAQCQGCHGIPDWKTAFPEVYRVPKLGGQKTAYIVAALKAYRSGERDFATMRAIAADLSDQDMEQLAAYYGAAALTTATAAPATPAAPATEKK